MTQHRLYGLRGAKYVVEYKRQQILKAFSEKIKDDGKFTPNNLGELCNQFQLSVKVMDEFLSEITDKYPSGAWDRLRDRGLKAKDIRVVWN